MRWKVDALIEARFEGPVDEAAARRLLQTELWRLVEGLEGALGTSMSTSIHIMDVNRVED